ncbi:MAG TPA: glycosyltransferase family 2 protein [Phnomibacter sp.]|nr:glycosyltransferase family 2 protein [Phnomibacter sp.]
MNTIGDLGATRGCYRKGEIYEKRQLYTFDQQLTNLMIFFSIVMPAYNAENEITETIQSILCQTYPHFELIVVNDGSTDNTKAIVEKFAESDTRIKLIDKINGRQAAARNAGIKAALHEWIAFVDSDDPWVNIKLERQVTDIKDRGNEIGLFFSNCYKKRDNQIFESDLDKSGKVLVGAPLVGLLADYNFIVPSTVVAKKNIIESVGAFDENPGFHNVEDFHLWMKLAIAGCKFWGSADFLCIRTIRNNSSSGRDRGQFFGVVLCLQTLKKKADAKTGFLITQQLKKKIREKSAIRNGYSLNGKLRIFWLKLKSIAL